MDLCSSGFFIGYQEQMKIRDKSRRENNLSLEENSWCHTLVTGFRRHASVVFATVCLLRGRKVCMCRTSAAFILCLFVNLHVSCVTLREGSKAPTPHLGWHTSRATKDFGHLLSVAREIRKPCGRVRELIFKHASAFTFYFIYHYALKSWLKENMM